MLSFIQSTLFLINYLSYVYLCKPLHCMKITLIVFSKVFAMYSQPDAFQGASVLHMERF